MSLIPILTQTQTTSLKDEPKFGRVVFNNDPEMVGRIKVVIPGIFEGNVENLPWIRRKNDTTFCGLDCELFDVPTLNSVVEVKWNYDENTPMYSGTPRSKKLISKAFTQNYPHEGGIKFGNNIIKFDRQKTEITITNLKNTLIMNNEGLCKLTCSNLTAHVSENTMIDCPTSTFSGDVYIQKNLTVNENVQVNQKINAEFDTTSNGISLVNHTHQYTAPAHPAGSSDTEKPTK